jgi:hypothetical protein
VGSCLVEPTFVVIRHAKPPVTHSGEQSWHDLSSGFQQQGVRL